MAALPSPVIEAWSFSAQKDSQTLVLPDGCRDLILRVAADGRPTWFVSELADGIDLVDCNAGERFVGYRFHPGARCEEGALLPAVQALGEAATADIEALIDEHVRVDGRLAEALDSLAESGGVAAACRRLGVSERSLERLMVAGTGRSPRFWKSLARVRRAAASLAGGLPLPAIAAEHGYADQAHMTRDFGRWFGTSPGRLRASPATLALVLAPGYG